MLCRAFKSLLFDLTLNPVERLDELKHIVSNLRSGRRRVPEVLAGVSHTAHVNPAIVADDAIVALISVRDEVPCRALQDPLRDLPLPALREDVDGEALGGEDPRVAEVSQAHLRSVFVALPPYFS